MVRNHEIPGMPETPEQNNNTRDGSDLPEWRPPHQVGNGRNLEKSSLDDELDRQLWAGILPWKPGESGPNSFTTKTTGYWPAPEDQAKAQKWEAAAKMEGGDKDREGNLIWPDHTIDAVEQKMKSGGLWPNDYVAVAMDSGAYPYGTNLTSPAYPGIPFRVVDTGWAFQWKWTSKVDIATSNYDRMSQLTADNVQFTKAGGGMII